MASKTKMMYDNRLIRIMDIKKMSKVGLISKIMREASTSQKNKMLRLVLKRMPKAMLVRLCVMVAKRNLPRLKLTTKKGDLRKTSRKAFTKKVIKRGKNKGAVNIQVKKKKRKLRAGVYVKKINGVMRKFRVMQNGQWRFMKMSGSMKGVRKI